MKIVHISFWEKSGGAAIAAYRIHSMMLNSGIDSFYIVYEGKSDGKNIFSLKNRFRDFQIYIYSHISSFLLSKYRPFLGNFSISLFGISSAILHNKHIKEADYIYIHWVNNFLLSNKAIKKLLNLNKNIIIVCHDMQPMTGGCHHSFGCVKYQENCGQCDLLKSKKKLDISYIQMQNKKKCIINTNKLQIVTPSRWMSDCASKSSLYKGCSIATIGNPIDIQIFNPKNQFDSREKLKLPSKTKLILFGADRGNENPYKGWKYFCEALKKIDNKNLAVVVFGSNNEITIDKYDIYNLGIIRDPELMSYIYSACDVFVIPSLAEAFGQTALESIACGTPVAGFNIGGIPDIIIHKKNGYLAKYKDSKDLAYGIEWLIKHPDREIIREFCHLSAKERYSNKIILEKHLELLK
jgi:glycosyltransferase involved in cell wall biosynthesis